ncbi:MAG: hypothetical protein ABIS86_16610 [Streptosporangiaceae bacterium]
MNEHRQVLIPVQHFVSPGVLQWEVCCPECGIKEIERSGPDHEAVTVEPDRDTYSGPLGTRGGYVNVDLYSAAGE